MEEDKNIGIHICNVCGKNINLEKDNIYQIQKRVFGILEINEYYDAIDCQFCGCQKLLNIRYKKINNKEEFKNGKND